MMLINWKKTTVFLRVIIIASFLLVFYISSSYYFVYRVEHKVSPTEIVAGQTFEFDFYPRGKSYRVGFELENPSKLNAENFDIIFRDYGILGSIIVYGSVGFYFGIRKLFKKFFKTKVN